MNHTSLHIGAERETIADTVLMPGDPMRSRFYCGTLSGTCGAGQQRPRHSGLYGHVPREARDGDGVRHGDAFHGDLFV